MSVKIYKNQEYSYRMQKKSEICYHDISINDIMMMVAQSQKAFPARNNFFCFLIFVNF